MTSNEPRRDVGAEPRDTRWAAHCRALQGWYREHILHLPAGYNLPAESGGRERRLVTSMLPEEIVDAKPRLNFLSSWALEAAQDRLRIGSRWGGIVQPDRLYRNMLSSQPLCFSLFGHLRWYPDELAAALTEILKVSIPKIVNVRLEWAPPRDRDRIPGPLGRSESLGGGSGFDAFIEYRTASGGRGFLGIETKYAENLGRQRPPLREKRPIYWECMDDARYGFKNVASADVLCVPTTCQLWINSLVATKLKIERPFDEGRIVLLASEEDPGARPAIEAIRSELDDPDDFALWGSYEDLVHALESEAVLRPWLARFWQRYLAFGEQEQDGDVVASRLWSSFALENLVATDWETFALISIEGATCGFGNRAALESPVAIQEADDETLEAGSQALNLIAVSTGGDDVCPVEIAKSRDGALWAARVCFVSDVDVTSLTWTTVGNIELNDGCLVVGDPTGWRNVDSSEFFANVRHPEELWNADPSAFGIQAAIVPAPIGPYRVELATAPDDADPFAIRIRRLRAPDR